MARTTSTLVDPSTLGPVRERLQRLDALHREVVAAMTDYLHLFQRVGPSPEVEAAWARVDELRERLRNCEVIALMVMRSAHGKGGKKAARTKADANTRRARDLERKLEDAARRGSKKSHVAKALGVSRNTVAKYWPQE